MGGKNGRLAIAAAVLAHYTRELDAEQHFRRTSHEQIAAMLETLQEVVAPQHLIPLVTLLRAFEARELESQQVTLRDVLRPSSSR
ncbi:MAG TPA: hypothetical protein VJ301_14510 [Propionibacteriaceae bacterium]|nr:hypothetical protein [Propionibacteriaceae bacterium]